MTMKEWRPVDKLAEAGSPHLLDQLRQNEDTIARLQAQLDEARAALRPFAELIGQVPEGIIDGADIAYVCAGHVRRAAAVYQARPVTGDEVVE